MIGTRTVSEVIRRKSVRYWNLIWSRTKREVTTASQVFEFDRRRLVDFCSTAPGGVNSFSVSGEPPPSPGAKWVPSVLLNLRVFAGEAHGFQSGLNRRRARTAGRLFRWGRMVSLYSPVMVGIDELDLDVFADAFEIAIAPVFKRVGGSFAAAFRGRAVDSFRPRGSTALRPAGPHMM